MVLTRSTSGRTAPRRSPEDSVAGAGTTNTTTRAATTMSTRSVPPIRRSQHTSSLDTTGAATGARAALSAAAPPTDIAPSLVETTTLHSGAAMPPPPEHRVGAALTAAVPPPERASHGAASTHRTPPSATHQTDALAPRPQAWVIHLSPPRSPSTVAAVTRGPPPAPLRDEQAPRPPTPARTRTTASRRSIGSESRLNRARARYELAAARIELLDAEAEMQNEEEEDARTVVSDDQRSQRVTTWLSEQQTHLAIATEQVAGVAPPPAPLLPPAPDPVEELPHRRSQYCERPPPQRAIYAPPPPPFQPGPQPAAEQTVANPSLPGAVALQTAPRTDISELAAAIALASRHTKLPSKYFIDLPIFAGSHQEWLPFRAAYNETAGNFSDVENTARLRRALKGRAKEAVENILLHYTDPNEIMRTLEARFGRPEAIAATELERLRRLPKLGDSPRDLIVFANKVANVVAALKALDRVHYLYNPDITTATSDKLPPATRSRWFDYSYTQPANEPDLIKLSHFLQGEADRCAPYAQPEPAPATTEGGREPRKVNQRVHTTQQRSCLTCETAGHEVPDCPKFKNGDVNTRWDAAKRARLCFRCLRLRNKKHFCKSKKCEIDGCTHFHHRLLHHRKHQEPKSEDTPPSDVNETVTTARAGAAYLKIAPVTVSGPAGELATWALLDDGSTVSLIDAGIADRVGAAGPVDPLRINTVGSEKIDASRSRRVSISLTGEVGDPQRLQLRTIDRLHLAPQRVRQEDLDECSHLRQISHLLCTAGGAPTILIGQDNWHLLTTTAMRKGRRDQPVASLTPLGWVLHGASRHGDNGVNFVAHLTHRDGDIEEQLREHFAIESLTVTPKAPRSDPDRRAEEMLREHSTQRPDGHYQTTLLWKNEDTNMPDNRDAALRRLVSIEKKLQKEPALAVKYEQQMTALISKGYAEPAPPTKTPGRTWYLPHFAVRNALKPDKLRIVHDAAAKTQGKSLNDFLLTGPDLLQSLPGVLMRFRQHAIAVTADIREMFMQVKIRPEDRDALRYLWRARPDDPPSEYRMTSLIFGATSSPATAIFIKNLNAAKHSEAYPEASAAVLRSHYMDDYLGSYETEDAATTVARQVRDIQAEARFELTKWTSNSTEVLRSLTEERATEEVAITGGPSTERVLGLVWRPDADKLTFNLDLARISPEILQTDTPTKREALKIVMSLYDPLGHASLVTVQGKKILQELWRRGTPWDTAIDADLSTQWVEWMSHLRTLRDVTVPRCYPGYTNAATLQLHAFADASETAYAAALYWRAVMPDGRVHTSLVLAKARVAPVKLTSIPRLELQAAVMASRMAAAVTEEHDRKPDSKYYWTDSKTVLTWLKTGSRSYRPFVAHRIAAIEDGSKLSEWRWVPTKMNVADDATRDVPRDFASDHRWFVGPEFLHLPEEGWPSDQPPPAETPTGEERCAAATTRDTTIQDTIPPAERFSRWERYLRSTARVLQFIELCRKTRARVHYKRTRRNKENDPTWKSTTSKKSTTYIERDTKQSPRFVEIPADMLRRAEHLIWQYSQHEAFYEEMKELERGQPVARHSRLHRLAVTFQDGLLRLKSRISNVTGVDVARLSPPILDADRHEVKLLLDYLHRRLHHAGAETTINECRQHYWVLRLRPVTKTVIHRCIPCRIRKGTPPQPSTGDLPPCRLGHHQPGFTFTGVDYFGPLNTVTGRTVNKRWVAIFTCLSSRAIHLEPAWTLSTSSAVMALRRMIARRGTPTEIWSDNGTNLRGADRELREAIDRATEQEAAQRTIRWRFIPPGAPFMGGAWERLVRSVKTALAAIEQPRHPTDEVLATLLAEVEYTVNSRPLTHVSVSPDDPEALTPNHLLLGGSARVPSMGTFDDKDLFDRASWRASQRLADLFWARWLREYLPELQHRREPHSRGPAVTIGDVVIIADNNLPRNTWPRGRVIATYPGADNIVRAVDVRTQGGVLRRPVKKLVVIPTQKTD